MSRVDANLGGYTSDVPVARGRSGTVYRSVNAHGTTVALKVYERISDAERERSCIEALDHSAIVTMVDADTTSPGGAWLALEWIEGMTLSHLLETTGPLPLGRTRDLIGQIAVALDAVHAAGFVHGDLAPSNILVSADDTITLVDFAAARRIGTDYEQLDATNGLEIETTPRYASPELARGQAAGPASEIYALAIITYEALTGQSPFPDVAAPIAMLGHHASSIPVAPTEHRPDLPAGVDDAVLRAFSKDPSERQPSAESFARALHQKGSARSRPARRRWARLAAVAVALVAAGWTTTMLTPADSATAPDETAEAAQLLSDLLSLDQESAAGVAAGAICNLVSTPGFEASSLPDSYYAGDLTNTANLAPGAGVEGSAALRLGTNANFGIFGEIIPLGPERDVVFSAWLRSQGDPTMTTLYVDYLDADYREITAMRSVALSRPAVGEPAGSRITILSQAPDDAAYAVPTFFKDGTAGSLLVDEVLFGSRSACLASGS